MISEISSSWSEQLFLLKRRVIDIVVYNLNKQYHLEEKPKLETRPLYVETTIILVMKNGHRWQARNNFGLTNHYALLTNVN